VTRKNIIIGAGVTGLSAGISSGYTVYEAEDKPGGLCTSYYMDQEGRHVKNTRLASAYRFERGGGHWIFGDDEDLLGTIRALSPVKKYRRRASVYFQDLDLYVPYPFQNHLHLFPGNIPKKVCADILRISSSKNPLILREWLVHNFGKTLCRLFFLPFHDLYTAGLTAEIASQDLFKSPIDQDTILQGLRKKTSACGYNTTFVYPKWGLDHFIKQMGSRCDIRFNKRAVRVDIAGKKVFFQDGSAVTYKKLISTLPLNEMIKLCDLRKFKNHDPYTSVLVFNIGAQRGPRCPKDHWVYIPKSQSGFHRVGFYSNVDASFLPKNSQRKDLVSLYVEKAFLPGDRPHKAKLDRLGRKIVEELKAWKYIKAVEVLSPTWIEHAYTWRFPGSTWRENAIAYLKGHGIHSIGRFGAWRFQGILESMKDGYSTQRG